MRKLVAALVLALLAACSGGSDGAAPSPTPSPTASPTPKSWTLDQACGYLLKIRNEGNAVLDKIEAAANEYNAKKASWRVVRDTARSATALRMKHRRQLSFPPDPWPALMASDLPAYRKGFLLYDAWENNVAQASTRQEMVSAFSADAMGQSTQDAYTAARESLKATCNWPK